MEEQKNIKIKNGSDFLNLKANRVAERGERKTFYDDNIHINVREVHIYGNIIFL